MPEAQRKTDKTFDELFIQCESIFRAYARSLLPTWDAVDEVLQSASLIMWRKLDQVDLPEGFLPWGKCIVRFEAQKYCRSKARDVHVFDPELVEILADHQDEGVGPDLDLQQSALEKCLAQISEANRRLVLAPYRGHGYLTQLAEASDRSRNSLYKQIRRIRHKLEACVASNLGKLVPER